MNQHPTFFPGDRVRTKVCPDMIGTVGIDRMRGLILVVLDEDRCISYFSPELIEHLPALIALSEGSGK